ncbi:MAG: MOSC domain-containing protein [Ginsengibacter sp.]
MLKVSHLFIYPVKSLGGIEVSSSDVGIRGLQHDRRFLLIDENNRFLTQREFPQMALLQTQTKNEELLIFPKQDPSEVFVLPLSPKPSGKNIHVQIWDDECLAQLISAEADKWFSENLKINCRLVYMPDSTQRNVDPVYAMNNETVNFPDAFPMLIFAQASFDELNNRLAEKLPIKRFRPNMVISGGFPFEEDLLKHFKINDINFYCVKPSARCVITTTDQQTGRTGKEPLKTLATFRQKNNKVFFGQNVLVSGEGKINVGDEIKIIDQYDESFLTVP